MLSLEFHGVRSSKFILSASPRQVRLHVPCCGEGGLCTRWLWKDEDSRAWAVKRGSIEGGFLGTTELTLTCVQVLYGLLKQNGTCSVTKVLDLSS